MTISSDPISLQSRGVVEAIGILGDKWVLLIIGEILKGASRFDQLQVSLGISRNVLSTKLALLVNKNLLEKCPINGVSGRKLYRPTEKCKALAPLFSNLEMWAKKHDLD